MEKLSDYLDSEIASIMANIVPCHGQCRNMERMLGTVPADSTIMQFRMDRPDQFMICEFLFALQ